MAITVHLDRLLVERGRSLTSLAEEIGLSLTQLSLFKCGHVKGIRFSTLEALCEALDCAPGDLLGRSSTRRPSTQPQPVQPRPVQVTNKALHPPKPPEGAECVVEEAPELD